MHRNLIIFFKYLCLFGVFLIYTSSGIFSKSASRCDFLSFSYLAFLSGCVFVLGVYAVLWQQVIKRMPVSDAYMLKSMTGFIGLAYAHFIFDEPITIANIVGTTIILLGVVFYARS